MNRREAAEYTLKALKKAGAQTASCRVTDGYTEELNSEAGEFSLYRTLFDSSLSMYAVKDGKKGTANLNSLEKKDIDEAAAGCVAAAEAAEPDDANDTAELIENKRFTDGVLEADKNALFDGVKGYMAELKDKYPKINLEQFIAKYKKSDTVFLNSKGVDFEWARGNYNYNSMFSGHDGDKSTSFNGYSADFTDPRQNFMDIGNNRMVIEDTLKQFDPQPIDGKFVGPVILSPECAEELLFYALMIFAGEANLINGTSIWKDKLNTVTSHSSLNIASNPRDSRIVCGERITGDGFEAKDTDIIKDGVLKSFILSLYGSKKTGNPRSANQSFNLIAAPGNKSLSEIIAGVDRGLLINRFSGGVPSANGDFSGVAKNSFAIKGGKMAGPINETMISGNLEKLLQSVVAISKETAANGSCVLPWLALDGVTISGK
ncbi:MAG: TldD/PmbA family protein [Clostridiales bacterium]|jgi:PmbA protein|nr:TldD/PmbA family protein [Clostridiales bacterium]